MGGSTKRQLHVLSGLQAEDFQHPLDAQATDALQRVPGLDKAIAKILELGLERLYYLDNVASNVRVTERMFGRMHRSLGWACQILDVEEPELYVSVNPVPNAWTFGHTRPFITLTTGLIDMLEEEERFFVIAHELGHIKAGHVLYTVIAKNIAVLVQLLGQATLGLGTLLGSGLAFALMEWQRKAELTADRAGLLCVQSMTPVTRTLMKLAGGATSMVDDMSQDEFLRQARDFEDADRSDLNRLYKILLTSTRTHPYAVQRAKEIDSWHQEHFATLLEKYGVSCDVSSGEADATTPVDPLEDLS